MREHLFRGFHPDDNGTTIITDNGKKIKGNWVEGNSFIPDDPSTPTQICMGTSTIRICYDVIPETVGEFTDLTDKNGKKIFEGDIVSVKNIEHCVDFVDGSFVLTPITNAYVHAYLIEYYKLCEIIGNIHDNPELLEDVE